MNEVIRKVRRDELDKVAELRLRALLAICGRRHPALTLARLVQHWSVGDEPAVAEGRMLAVADGQRLVAVGTWSRSASKLGMAEIDGLAVDPAFAGKGRGGLLMVELEMAAAEAGAAVIELSATLPTALFFVGLDYAPADAVRLTLEGGIQIPMVRMHKDLRAAIEAASRDAGGIRARMTGRVWI
jgi:GNAT superfamily N-acetyltransferase